MKTRLLFVCTANRQRSPTAEGLFRDHPRYDARSCGIHPLATTPADAALIAWADVIVCMESTHRDALVAAFPEAAEKQMPVLGIPDVYERDDPHLIKVLQFRLKRYLGVE